MEITCKACNSMFVLPEDRIPESRKFKLNCPKCRAPILVDQDSMDEKIVAPEHFPHDAVVAFVFVKDRDLAGRIAKFLKGRGIFISEARFVHEAVDKVRINYYNILVLEDSEESRTVLGIVRKWNGLRRREVNIVLVEARCQSMHPNEAFLRGVNTVIGAGDSERIESFLDLALGEYTKYVEPWAEASNRLRQKG
jgi:DNA-directed RNA polymerase subunit M/transcription elongation factor TFIIS